MKTNLVINECLSLLFASWLLYADRSDHIQCRQIQFLLCILSLLGLLLLLWRTARFGLDFCWWWPLHPGFPAGLADLGARGQWLSFRRRLGFS